LRGRALHTPAAILGDEDVFFESTGCHRSEKFALAGRESTQYCHVYPLLLKNLPAPTPPTRRPQD